MSARIGLMKLQFSLKNVNRTIQAMHIYWADVTNNNTIF